MHKSTRIVKYLMIILASISSLRLIAVAEGKVTLTGLLVDQMCGAEVKDAAKAAEHTKECSLMDHCASSGFGIFAEGKYVKFDEEGSKQAKALVEKSKKQKGITVVAEGNLKGETLALTSLKEK
jgi:hypothetical protein